MIYYSIAFLVLSFLMMLAMIFRGAAKLQVIPREEFKNRFNATRPFWDEFHDFIIVPAIKIYHEKIRPAVYKEIEKLARRFRIIVLRVECLLLRFAEYIKGKRTMPLKNGWKSKYWESLNNCKSNLYSAKKKGKESTL